MEDANQNNVEVSMAAAAAEEAQGKGSVDGIMEVQEVTESSGPVQPKSLNGLPSDFRNRNGSKGKSKLEQGGSEVNLDSSKAGYLAPKEGVDSEQGRRDRNLLKAIRDGVGAVRPANSPRQKLGYTKLGSQKKPMKDVMEDEPVLNKEDENEPMLQSPVSPSIPRVRPSSESAVVTVGTMEMENRTNTHSNPSQENAESSWKSKTAEWALLVTSVVLEATSASCDQLGYALTSMVMAFIALFLSILDLILKARGREITCDGRGLPCFNRHSSHDPQNREPFAGVVQYFSLAGALWQCSFTIVGYHYIHQKLVNPIKLCLLPFILALCVLISKVVKSSQHER